MIGTQIASYRILEKLGEGGMGTVYKAVDTALDRMVAVKVLSSGLAANAELVERFRTEAKAQANLNHTNLATLYAFVIQDGRAAMVMEFVDGVTFEQMILRQGALPVSEALPLFKQALLGIGYAHRAGIVHRDIKPSNLMVNRMGIVKVMDFGIAKVMGARGITRTGVQMGTGWYMSPEQVLNRPVDIRSDIYSLGVTLYQMITAHVPFDGPSDYQIMTDQVNTPPPLPTSFSPEIPRGVENAVLKALEKNPDARFQTVEEFGAALEHPQDFGIAAPVAAPVVPAAPVAAAAVAAAPKAQFASWLTAERKIIAGAAALVLLLVAGWAALRPHNTDTVVLPAAASSGGDASPANQSQPSAGQNAAEFSSKKSTEVSQQPVIRPAPRVVKQAAKPVSTIPAAPSAGPQITFDALPGSIPRGATTRLRWNLLNAKTASIAPAPGVLRQARGEFLVAPMQTTTYTLTAASKDGAVATATATVQVIQSARPAFTILVQHDHGFAPNIWPQCWGQLLVVGGHLQYRVAGTNDGRRDDFDVLASQIQDVNLNRVLTRNLPAFHVTINGRVLNFIPRSTSAAQAAMTIQQLVNAR